MRQMMMKSVAIVALALAPNLAMAQGGPAGADRGGPNAGDHKIGQGPGDRDRSRPDGGAGAGQRAGGDRGDQRMRGDKADDRGDRQRGDRADDRGDRQRGDNDRRPGGDRDRVRVDNDRRPVVRDRTTVRITTEQRAQVRTRFRNLGGERIRGGDFAVNVGRAVPTRYRFSRLPPEIVDILPEYRDFDYVMVGDQVLIVDPDTREIVYVLD